MPDTRQFVLGGETPEDMKTLAYIGDAVCSLFIRQRLAGAGGHVRGLTERAARYASAQGQARAAEGHVFGSHTFDHVYWRADRAEGGFDVRPSAGPQAGVTRPMTAAQYCAELARPAARLAEITGRPAMAALFRAPGGKTSPALLAAASRCGWTHVGWSPAGFLGDELPSERFSNDGLLRKALRDVRPGDILLAHLGIWSRQDAWAPAVLEPLIRGLKARGHCFATLAEHPTLGAAARRPAPTPTTTTVSP